jgi:hypothetical protein
MAPGDIAMLHARPFGAFEGDLAGAGGTSLRVRVQMGIRLVIAIRLIDMWRGLGLR